MSWFNTSGITTLAKSALTQAQKTIDKALDIRDDVPSGKAAAVTTTSLPKKPVMTASNESDTFFASFGIADLSEPVESDKSVPENATFFTNTKKSSHVEKSVSMHSIWGSFTGSFFDPTLTNDSKSDDSYCDTAVTEAIASQPKTSLYKKSRTVSLSEKPESFPHSRDNKIEAASQDSSTHKQSCSESMENIQLTLFNEVDYLDNSVQEQTLLPSLSNDDDSEVTAMQPCRSSRSMKLDSSSPVDDMIQPSDVLIFEEEAMPLPCAEESEDIKSTDDIVNQELSPSLTCDFNEMQHKENASISDEIYCEEAVGGNDFLHTEDLPDVERNGRFPNADQEKETLKVDVYDGLLSVYSVPHSLVTMPVNNLVGKTQTETSTDKLQEKLTITVAETKVVSTSLCSTSSSSTIGESSSTLEESVGTLSGVSDKDGHSSETLTPDLFSDSGESAVPIGMSSSWDAGLASEMPEGGGADQHSSPEGFACIERSPVSSDLIDGMAAIESDIKAPVFSQNDDSLVIKETHISPTSKENEEANKLTLSPASDTEKEICLRENLQSSTSSFVCYMLEAAMEESVQPVTAAAVRAHSPNSTISSSSSTAERSDLVKTAESEQNSGHTSGDEIETTTSSDIEIISSPSGGGESGGERGGSVSPVKPNPAWRPQMGKNSTSSGSSSCRQGNSSIRSDSPASDTSSVKDCFPVHFGLPASFRPDLAFVTTNVTKANYHHRNLLEHSPEESEGNLTNTEALVKKLSELTAILEAREAKVLDLSRENMEQREKSMMLKAQLKKIEEVRAADNRDVSTLTKDFTERLSSTEKRLQQTMKEKEALKVELQRLTQEISSSVSSTQVEEIKKDKDTQIMELMQEGEKLSKQLLVYSNNVKKLRIKEKENENHIKQQREKIEEQSRELERVRKALGAKEEVEKNQIELIRQLTNNVQKLEKETSTLKSDLEDAQEKQRSIKVAMDGAYKELGELHRKNAEKDSQAQEAALSAEMVAKEELKACLERVQHEARLQQESLLLQIEDLRVGMVRCDQQSGRREQTLRQDIANLQERLQEAEGRNEELNQSVSAATRPLLRQIDNLQSTLNSQTASWERVERNLTDRLNEAQNQLAYATEKERASTERYAEISSKMASLEAQTSLLRQERATLQMQLKHIQDELQAIQETRVKDNASLEVMKQSFADELSRLKREKEILDHQLEIEKTALEAEKRKTNLLQDQLKDKEHHLIQLSAQESSSHNSPSPQGSISMKCSFNEQFQSSWFQEDASESGFPLSGVPSARMNVYESLRTGSTTTLLDGLQTQLKLRDGDIMQLQVNIVQLEKVKESMTQELVKLTSQNEELEANVRSLTEQANQYKGMQQKYNALLQMYGEISEEAEELRLDLQDVKDMYKAQIDELMKRK